MLSRTTKASFNQTRWGSFERDYARNWAGEGIDPDLVDAERLRAAWLNDDPPPGADYQLHAAWLASSIAARTKGRLMPVIGTFGWSRPRSMARRRQTRGLAVLVEAGLRARAPSSIGRWIRVPLELDRLTRRSAELSPTPLDQIERDFSTRHGAFATSTVQRHLPTASADRWLRPAATRAETPDRCC